MRNKHTKMPQPCELSIVSRKYLKEYDRIIILMSEKMLLGGTSSIITIDFILRMIHCHKATIQIAENLLCFTTNLKLQNIALCIIKRKSEEIKIMEEIESIYNCKKNEVCDIIEYIECCKSAIKSMIDRMIRTCRLNSIELNFIDQMIWHHEGCINICKNAIKYDVHKKIKSMCDEIIIVQTKEIKELRQIQMWIVTKQF